MGRKISKFHTFRAEIYVVVCSDLVEISGKESSRSRKGIERYALYVRWKDDYSIEVLAVCQTKFWTLG